MAGAAIALATSLFHPAQALLWGSNSFFIAYLILSLSGFARASNDFLKSHAADEDAPAWVIFVVTLAVIVAAFVSLFTLVAARDGSAVQLVATMISVPLGWLTVHAMAAHHYSYAYYSARHAHNEHSGGLDFPTGDAPDGLSFLYFAYVIGMTAQVADVSVTSRRMQRLVLMHGIFSFFYNTVIVAASVNIVVSL
jgi:uncharacterized membrane protein